MAGMLQILTYLLGFYLFVKGLTAVQFGLASDKPGPLVLGFVILLLAVSGAIAFAVMQDNQAQSLSAGFHMPTDP